MIRVTPLETPGLGNHSHIATDGTVAVVVDPPRDVDRCVALCGRLGVQVTWVLETHVHNDYVSGGLELARITGARYGLAAAEEVSFAGQRVGLRDRDVITTGSMAIRVVHTPGHTDHHLAYVLGEAAGGRPLALFSGGSWLHGTAGRTDLLGSDRTEPLARAQWRSIRRLAEELPATVELHPTHGFGSFCAPGGTAGDALAELGAEAAHQPALLLDEDPFVRQLIAGFIAYPSYYPRMAPINRSGPGPIDLRPAPEAAPEEPARRAAAGEWIIDLRPRTEFAGAHLAGWINIEGGDFFATYLGWLLPWGTPVVLAGEEEGTVAAAQRAMALIGIDRPAAQVARPFAGRACRCPGAGGEASGGRHQAGRGMGIRPSGRCPPPPAPGPGRSPRRGQRHGGDRARLGALRRGLPRRHRGVAARRPRPARGAGERHHGVGGIRWPGAADRRGGGVVPSPPGSQPGMSSSVQVWPASVLM